MVGLATHTYENETLNIKYPKSILIKGNLNVSSGSSIRAAPSQLVVQVLD